MFLDRNESGLDSDIRHTAPVSGGVGGSGEFFFFFFFFVFVPPPL